MKNIISILIVSLFAIATPMEAQKAIKDPNKMWTVPAMHTMDEEITWYFDFADAKEVEDGEALYLWIWSPTNPTGEPIPINYNGDRIWSITFTPTTFFKMSVDEIFAKAEDFYFLIRTLAGDKMTGTLSRPKVDHLANFISGGKQFDYGPVEFKYDEPVSIFFNSNKVDNFNPAPSTLHLHSGLNDWEVSQPFEAWKPEIRQKTQMKDLGNGIYKINVTPKSYYGITEEFEMENLAFLVVKYNGNDGAPDWAGTSPDYKILAPGVPEPPAPAFYIFPMIVSIQDVLILTRDNNDRGQRLSYKITGGTKILEGEFEGTMSRQRVFFNLASEFKGMDVSQLHIHVFDQNNKTIVDTNISLSKVDQPTR